MKIALCLSGHVRNIESTFNSLKKNVLDLHDVDVFLHSWDTHGWRVEGLVSKSFKGFDYYSSKIDEQKIVDLLKPKRYKFEVYTDIEQTFIQKSERYKDQLRVPDRDRPSNLVSSYYKIKKCNELKKEYEKENNFTYDLVIRSRFDIEYSNILLDQTIINNKDEYIFVPYELSYGYASDLLSISNSKNIDTYCDLYDNLDFIYENGCLMNPHNVLKFWLDKNFGPKRVNYDLKVILNRCRKKCQNKLVCDECHPENTSYSKG